MPGRRCQFVEDWRCMVQAKLWTPVMNEMVWLDVCAACRETKVTALQAERAQMDLDSLREARFESARTQKMRLEIKSIQLERQLEMMKVPKKAVNTAEV